MNICLDFRRTKKGRANQSLPKRGEKAFEPSAKGTSAYQQFMLENARRAMQDALEEPRQIQVYAFLSYITLTVAFCSNNLSSFGLNRFANRKRLSQGIWQPRFGTVHMLEAKGAGFTNIGCSIRRPGSTEKKLELLPEEALYLIERGSLLCWEQIEGQESQAEEPEERRGDPSDPVQIIGVPLSVQQSFAVMIGKTGLTFERYQVYAYLRRFGYVVRRSDPPDSVPEWSVYRHLLPRAGFLSWIWSRWNHLLNTVAGWKVNWWKPMCFGLLDRLWGRNLNSSMHFILDYECAVAHRSLESAFDKLRVIPAWNSSQGYRIVFNSRCPSPYRVFYQAWKPSVCWTRQNTPPPDFEIVVIK